MVKMLRLIPNEIIMTFFEESSYL